MPSRSDIKQSDRNINTLVSVDFASVVDAVYSQLNVHAACSDRSLGRHVSDYMRGEATSTTLFLHLLTFWIPLILLLRTGNNMCHLSPPLLDKCKSSLHQKEEEDMFFLACVVQVQTEHAQWAVAHFITAAARCQSCATLCVPLIVSAAPINHFLPLFLALWLLLPLASPLSAVSHFLFPHALVHRVIELHSRRRRRVIKPTAVHTSDVCRPQQTRRDASGRDSCFFLLKAYTFSKNLGPGSVPIIARLRSGAPAWKSHVTLLLGWFS